MQKPAFNDTATAIAVTRNKWGDEVFGATTSRKCQFRDISMLNRGVNHREDTSEMGLIWFDPSDGVVNKGDIFMVSSIHYRVEKVIVGRARLTSNQLHFYKCEVSLLRQIS